MLKRTLLDHFIEELSALNLWRNGDGRNQLSNTRESEGVAKDDLDVKD